MSFLKFDTFSFMSFEILTGFAHVIFLSLTLFRSCHFRFWQLMSFLNSQELHVCIFCCFTTMNKDVLYCILMWYKTMDLYSFSLLNINDWFWLTYTYYISDCTFLMIWPLTCYSCLFKQPITRPVSLVRLISCCQWSFVPWCTWMCLDAYWCNLIYIEKYSIA